MTQDHALGRQKASDGRRHPRIDSTLCLYYQRISPLEIKKDPYDNCFELPRYFSLAADIHQIDAIQRNELQALLIQNPLLGGLIDSLNLKVNLLAQAMEDSLARLVSPIAQRVNVSEGGLSFHAFDSLAPGSHLHLAISNPNRGYHIAAIANVVYCESEDLEGFRTGVTFVNLHERDRRMLAQDIHHKQEENLRVAPFERLTEI